MVESTGLKGKNEMMHGLQVQCFCLCAFWMQPRWCIGAYHRQRKLMFSAHRTPQACIWSLTIYLRSPPLEINNIQSSISSLTCPCRIIAAWIAWPICGWHAKHQCPRPSLFQRKVMHSNSCLRFSLRQLVWPIMHVVLSRQTMCTVFMYIFSRLIIFPFNCCPWRWVLL